jgi:uncharacterized protein YkwD
MRLAAAWMPLALCALGLACPGLADDKKDKPKEELSRDEQALLELTNKERAKQKLPPLKANAVLSRVARDHSANMARKKEMNHVLDGKNPKDRVRASGYKAGYIGENIAWSDDPRTKMVGFMELWMNSRQHRENILGKNYEEIGLGVVRVDKNTVYCTQVFARPAGRPR